MAAPNAYRAKSASFAASGKLGLTSCRVSQSGQTTDLITDGVDSVRAIFVDGLVSEVSISVSALDGVEDVEAGDVGALVLIFEKRAEGRGAAASGNMTCTLANAVCTGNDYDAGVTGVGAANLSFRCSAPDGGSAAVWS